MNPSITYHGIACLELSPIEWFTAEETKSGHAFASRDLVITGQDGRKCIVSLFASTADGLRTPEERKRESHDPKPDSGDDPRYVGPEYDKYEAREHEPDYDHVGEQERYEQAWRDRP